MLHFNMEPKTLHGSVVLVTDLALQVRHIVWMFGPHVILHAAVKNILEGTLSALHQIIAVSHDPMLAKFVNCHEIDLLPSKFIII